MEYKVLERGPALPGQVLSTRRDLLPAEFTAELSLRPDIR